MSRISSILIFVIALAITAAEAPAQNQAQSQSPVASAQTQQTARQALQKPTGAEKSSTRIKNIAQFLGVRENQLIGYGLVVGLNRTGDKTQQNLFTKQALQNLLERMGLTVRAQDLRPENLATVLVTANLPPFARPGSKIDVTVSSIGDARSLQGGVLILTTLKGIDGQIYAVAQGPITTGGFLAGNNAANSVQVNHPTVGRIPNGATVEREVPFSLDQQQNLTLVLNEADFTTVSRAAQAINKTFEQPIARALDGRTIVIDLPETQRARLIEFMAMVENVEVASDTRARVVINERTGTIILGKEVKIASVAITQGNLSIRIGTQFFVSQPAPFSRQGETRVVPDQIVTATESEANSVVLPEGATIEQVVRGLNAVGLTARDIMNILQAIKSAGALQAELELN